MISEHYGIAGNYIITSINNYTFSASGISSQGSGSTTVTITADSNADDYLIFPIGTGWGTVSSISRSGTTVTVNVINVSNGAHGISGRLYVIGYKAK